MKASDLKMQIMGTLKQGEIEDYHFEQRQMFFNVGISDNDVMNGAEVPQNKLDVLENFVQRRLKGEPLQYILGGWEFYGVPIKVGPGVLIPRPETELIADLAISKLPREGRLLDLCTGSGCIPIAVAVNRPDVTCTALELSDEAIEYTKQNIVLNKVEKRVEVLKCDVRSDECPRRFFNDIDVITANPPYLTDEDMKNLQREVTFEPKMALAGGRDGMDFYRDLFAIWCVSLKKGGAVILEVDDSQAEQVEKMLKDGAFETKILRDYNGKRRVVHGWSTL